MAEPGFPFVGERPCLDFVNTEVIADGCRLDLLTGFDALVAWCAAAGTIGASQAREMGQSWRGERSAEKAFKRGVELRTTLREMAERMAAGRPMPPAVLDGINDVLRTRTGELVLVRTKEGYATEFRGRLSEPLDLLVPVAESAASLLSSGDAALVKKCSNPACILYFCDTTKNHARRWCSMSGCGNRAKVAAHYQRSRRASTPGKAKV